MKIMYKGEIIDTKDLKKIGGNSEGIVYRYNNDALKVYHKRTYNNKCILSQDMCERLMKIKTKQILLPKDITYTFNEKQQTNYGGAGATLVKNPISLYEMWQHISPQTLQEQDNILKEDLNILSTGNVALSDMSTFGNFLYNKENSMYFVDYGDYTFSDSSDLEQRNLEEFNLACHNHLLLLGQDKDNIENEICDIAQHDVIISDMFLNLILNIYEDVYEEEFHYSYEDYLVFLQYILEEYGTIYNFKMELLENAIDNGRYDGEYPEELELLERILRR